MMSEGLTMVGLSTGKDVVAARAKKMEGLTTVFSLVPRGMTPLVPRGLTALVPRGMTPEGLTMVGLSTGTDIVAARAKEMEGLTTACWGLSSSKGMAKGMGGSMPSAS